MAPSYTCPARLLLRQSHPNPVIFRPVEVSLVRTLPYPNPALPRVLGHRRRNWGGGAPEGRSKRSQVPSGESAFFLERQRIQPASPCSLKED